MKRVVPGVVNAILKVDGLGAAVAKYLLINGAVWPPKMLVGGLLFPSFSLIRKNFALHDAKGQKIKTGNFGLLMAPCIPILSSKN